MKNTLKIIVFIMVLSVLMVGTSDCRPIEMNHGVRSDSVLKPELSKKDKSYGVKSGNQYDQEYITVEPSDFALSNNTETHDPNFEYGNEDDMLVGR